MSVLQDALSDQPDSGAAQQYMTDSDDNAHGSFEGQYLCPGRHDADGASTRTPVHLASTGGIYQHAHMQGVYVMRRPSGSYHSQAGSRQQCGVTLASCSHCVKARTQSRDIMPLTI